MRCTFSVGCVSARADFIVSATVSACRAPSDGRRIVVLVLASLTSFARTRVACIRVYCLIWRGANATHAILASVTTLGLARRVAVWMVRVRIMRMRIVRMRLVSMRLVRMRVVRVRLMHVGRVRMRIMRVGCMAVRVVIMNWC